MTDPKMVKNFRVVVIMEQVSGPNVETVMKMKVCPAALAKPNVTILASIDGCLSMKPKNAMPSPVTIRPIADHNIDHTLMLNIMLLAPVL